MKKIILFIVCLWNISARTQSLPQKALLEQGVRMPIDTAISTEKNNIAGWGDSQFEISPGVLYRIGLVTGRYVYNGGVAGENAFFIRNRMIADVSKHSWATIIWAGRNGVLNTPISSVMPYIKQMVDSVKNGNYVIINLINGGGEGIGTAAYDSISRFNDSLVARWGVRVFDANATVKTWYTSSPADQANLLQDVAPLSSRSDSIHLTDTAYRRLADSLLKYKGQYIGYTNNNLVAVSGLINSLNGNSDGMFNSLSVSDRAYYTFYVDGRTRTASGLLYQGSAIMGSQLLTNPDFNGNLTGWTPSSGDWIYANGGATHVSGNTTPLTQTINVDNNAQYEVIVYATGISGGANIAQISFLGSTMAGLPNSGSTTKSRISYSASTSTLSIIPSSTFTGTVDSVSIRRIDRDIFLPSIRAQYSLKDKIGSEIITFNGNRLGVIGIGGTTINYNAPFSRVLNAASYSLSIGSGSAPNMGMTTDGVFLGNRLASYVPQSLNTTLIGSQIFNASNVVYLEKQTAIGNNIFTGNTGYNNIGIGVDIATGTTSFNRSLIIGQGITLPSSSEAGQVNIAGLIFGRNALATSSNPMGRVGVGTNNPDASSIVDLTSTTAGFLIPRMTTAQANAIPTRANGLLVLNSDSIYRPFLWDGSAWRGVRYTNESAVSSSSDYTPVITNVSNLVSSSGETATYYRIGDKVHIDGSFSVELTATVSTTINMSMPFASNFTGITDAKGMCSFVSSTSNGGTVTADTTNDLISFNFEATNTSGVVTFSLSYTVK